MLARRESKGKAAVDPAGPHRHRYWSCACTACRAEFQVIVTRGAAIVPIAVILILIPPTSIKAAPSEHMSAAAAFAVSLAVDAMAVAFLYAFLQLRLTAAAYTYHDSGGKTVPVDWAAPGWVAIGDRLRAAGVNPARLNAITAFSRGLNLSTVHQAANPPGLLGRMSLWEVRWRRPLMIIGAVTGVTIGVVSAVMPSADTSDRTPAHQAASWSLFRVLIAAGLAGLLLTAIYSVIVMIRRNITSPRFAIVIPSGWRHHFAGKPSPAAALLCHEFSHLRHRDALHRRIIFTLGHWTSFASVFSAVMAAGLSASGKQGLAVVIVIPLMTVSAAGGVFATRRARRLFPLAQEIRADAEVLGQGFTAEELSAGLTALHKVAQDSTLATRLRLVAAGADGPFLPGFRTMVRLAGLTYVLPVVALAGMALA